MPAFSKAERQKLKYLNDGGNAILNPGRLACWNWALTGFNPAAINPSNIFSYVSGFVQVGDLVGPWYNSARTLARLNALRARWAPLQRYSTHHP